MERDKENVIGAQRREKLLPDGVIKIDLHNRELFELALKVDRLLIDKEVRVFLDER